MIFIKCHLVEAPERAIFINMATVTELLPTDSGYVVMSYVTPDEDGYQVYRKVKETVQNIFDQMREQEQSI